MCILVLACFIYMVMNRGLIGGGVGFRGRVFLLQVCYLRYILGCIFSLTMTLFSEKSFFIVKLCNLFQ